MSGLLPWVRRIHRVRAWVHTKISIHAARISLRKPDAASSSEGSGLKDGVRYRGLKAEEEPGRPCLRARRFGQGVAGRETRSASRRIWKTGGSGFTRPTTSRGSGRGR